jgi:hypothetical protein
MVLIIAVAHILGTLIALYAFESGVLALYGWELERNQRVAAEEISIALGIPVENLANPENVPKVVRFNAERFSSDLFLNRVSDLCGWVQVGWSWLARLLGVGVLLGTIWYSFTDGPQNAIYAWLAIPIAIVFSITSILFAIVCKLVTGRFPGQARQARKELAQYINSQTTELTGEG